MMYLFFFIPHKVGVLFVGLGFFFIGFWVFFCGICCSRVLRASLIRNLVGVFLLVLVWWGLGLLVWGFFNYMLDVFEFLVSSVLLHFCQVNSFSITDLFCSGGQTCDRTGTEP